MMSNWLLSVVCGYCWFGLIAALLSVLCLLLIGAGALLLSLNVAAMCSRPADWLVNRTFRPWPVITA